ncbi:RICIN domain-containing protein [Amycolatopsis sp. NPDC058278]|uniref:RICIN domain-containing protein n=1 Tax=Amycolatopsis sp. NPDC058278 TaxID=3346417 RepID=UPI0036D8450F
MKLKSRIFAVIAAAVAMGLGVAAPATAETNQTLEIKSVALGKCLAVGAPTYAWATVEDCTGAKNQQWEQIRVDADKVILRNLGDRTCLKGISHVVRYECDDEDEDQYWVLTGDRLTNAKTGQVADTTLYDDFGVFLADARRTDYQRWQVRVTGNAPAPPADTSGQIVQLQSVSERKCAAASGTAVQLPACTVAVEQKFQRVELGDGVVQLRNLASGTCLRTGSFGLPRVDLVSACAADDPAQQWRIEPDLVGTVRVRNVASGNYLTPRTDDITTYERTSLANWQKWSLVVA